MVAINLGIPEKFFDEHYLGAAPADSDVFASPALATQITWQTIFDSAPDEVEVQLLGSNDGTSFDVLDTSTEVNGESRTVFASSLFLKVTLASATGGNHLTVSLVAKLSAFGSNPTFGAGLTVNGFLDAQRIRVNYSTEGDFNGYINAIAAVIDENNTYYGILHWMKSDAPWASIFTNELTPDNFNGFFSPSDGRFEIWSFFNNDYVLTQGQIPAIPANQSYFFWVIKDGSGRPELELYNGKGYGYFEDAPVLFLGFDNASRQVNMVNSADAEVSFFGSNLSSTPSATVKASAFVSVTDGIAFPSSDPHIAGRWWDNGTSLVRSAG